MQNSFLQNSYKINHEKEPSYIKNILIFINLKEKAVTEKELYHKSKILCMLYDITLLEVFLI